MGILILIVFWTTMWLSVIYVFWLIYRVLKYEYEQGYNECKLSYQLSKELKKKENPVTAYEFGWNKANTEILQKNRCIFQK
jgi:hypothetical protein